MSCSRSTPRSALYEHPVNLFVAGFIGSPAMNLFEATLVGGDGEMGVEFGGFRLPVPAEVVADRPDLKRYVDQTIVLGIRPEDMEDASLVSDAPAERRHRRGRRAARGAWAPTSSCTSRIDAPQPLTEDVRELAVDVGAEALEHVEAQARRGQSNVLARLNPRTQARKGEPIELVVDTHRLHFFDPGDGTGIYGDAA